MTVASAAAAAAAVSHKTDWQRMQRGRNSTEILLALWQGRGKMGEKGADV